MSAAARQALPLLVGDVGGTNSRFALSRAGVLDGASVRRFENDDHASLEDALETYLRAMDIPVPSAAVIAVAGPVSGGRADLTNRDWEIGESRLRARPGFRDVRLLNDFEALAWLLPALAPDHIRRIGGGGTVEAAARIVLGPGTGLGLAAAVPAPGGWAVVPGEAGHVELAAVNRREFEALELVRVRHGRSSAERILSGPGLETLDWALRALDGDTAPPRAAEAIIAAHRSGANRAATEAVAAFCEMLGRFAGDMALVFGARGGVYIAGGVALHLREELAASRFRRAFEAKGRFAPFLADIATSLIVAPDPGLLGCAAFAAGCRAGAMDEPPLGE